jgi:hypothetical protein
VVLTWDDIEGAIKTNAKLEDLEVLLAHQTKIETYNMGKPARIDDRL